MKMIIGGQFCDAVSGEVLEAINPATGEVLDTFPAAGKADVERCLQIAQEGKRLWSAKSMNERTQIMRAIPEVFRKNAREITECLCREMGKPIVQCKEDLDVTIEIFENITEEARHLEGRSFMDLGAADCPGDLQFTRYDPLGVVVCIAPSNFPLDTLAQKVSAALAMGNAIIIVPPRDVTLSLIIYTRLLLEAGIPPQVVQILTGDGAAYADDLIQTSLINAVSFTGSTKVGIQIYRNSAPYMHRLILELGGNDPFVIFEDADLDQAVQECWMRLRNSGQTCCAPKRYIVHNSVKQAFCDKLIAWLKNFTMGDPTSRDTHIGTVINERSAQKVMEQIEKTVEQGGRIVYGGKRDGAFVEPTVIMDVPRDADVAFDMEIFGPVFPIIGFDTEEEAVEIANQTIYGLNAGCMSADMVRSLRVASKLQAGTVVANGCSTWRGPEIPFGGYKMSGLLREGGRYTLVSMCEEKTIAIRRVK